MADFLNKEHFLAVDFIICSDWIGRHDRFPLCERQLFIKSMHYSGFMIHGRLYYIRKDMIHTCCGIVDDWGVVRNLRSKFLTTPIIILRGRRPLLQLITGFHLLLVSVPGEPGPGTLWLHCGIHLLHWSLWLRFIEQLWSGRYRRGG